MQTSRPLDGGVVFLARQPLNFSVPPGVWRIAQGAFSISQQHGDSVSSVLAMPGDLVGIERLGVSSMTLSCKAITNGRLVPVIVNDACAEAQLLRAAYDQSRAQSVRELQLRTGPMPERLRHLLLLLGDLAGEEEGVAELQLPTLRQMAELTDSTAESVCRVLTRLKGQSVLQASSAGRLRMKLCELRESGGSPLWGPMPAVSPVAALQA